MRYLAVHILTVMIVGLVAAVCAGPARAQDFQRTTLLVENLEETSCLDLIEANFKKTPGVVGMTADLKSGTVTAEHIPRIKGKQLAEAVSSLGYPARIVKQEAVAEKHINGFSNSFARCGIGGRRSSCCNATASAWKELYRRYIKKLVSE